MLCCAPLGREAEDGEGRESLAEAGLEFGAKPVSVFSELYGLLLEEFR